MNIKLHSIVCYLTPLHRRQLSEFMLRPCTTEAFVFTKPTERGFGEHVKILCRGPAVFGAGIHKLFEAGPSEWIDCEASPWSFRVWILNAPFLNQASHRHHLVFVILFHHLLQDLTVGHAPGIARIFHNTSPDVLTDMTSAPWSSDLLFIRPWQQGRHFCLTSVGSEVSRSRAAGLANISSESELTNCCHVISPAAAKVEAIFFR